MAKQYVPAEHESRIRDRWDSHQVGRANPTRVDRGAKPTHEPGAKRPPYAIFIPPPNVTGQLHLGHALNNTLQDILTRTHRMMGYEALWMPGTDHAGIATQAVVEKRLLKEENKRRKDFSREEFIARVQTWKDEYEARITEQLKAMGCSCDFSRQRFTMDDICARAVREAFFRLFKDGLIYRGKRLVNWDPALQTAVADDECYEEEVEAAFYYLRYPLVGKSALGADSSLRPITWSELATRGYPGAGDHPGDQQAWVTVATTRPETYLGDTAVAISQHDPRAAALRGLQVQLPLVGRVIPIIEDTSGYVVLPKDFARSEEERNDPKAEFATGFLKVTPAHDNNDYQLGQLYAEQIKTNSAGEVLINILSPDGRLSDQHGWSDVGDARRFVGMKVMQTHDGIRQPAEARKAVVEALKGHPIGSDAYPVLEKVRPYRQTLKFSDRSKALIEPYLSDQWFCKVTDDRMAGAANRALAGGDLAFHPDRYAKTYEQWHTGIRDWCISRQLWWGHRIPVWSLDLDSAGHDRFRAHWPRLQDWQAQGRIHGRGMAEGDGSSSTPNRDWYFVSVRSADDREVMDALEQIGFTQDPDVLDTWFSSALWPLSTLGWPDPDQSPDTRGLLSAFNPSSLLSTAREIITLWVSRMVMMNRYLLGEGGGRGPVPFKDVFIHAVVQDGDGKRMSKSAGNGVDPLDIIASHGADAMRFTLCQMTTSTQDVRMPVVKDAKTGRNTSPKFDLGRNVCNKLWNAARFAMTMLEGASGDSRLTPQSLSPVDRWMLSRLSQASAAIAEAIKNYEFSVYAQALYDLLWRDFCDWYLEAIKPTVQTDPGTRAVLVHTLEAILRLAHPLLPYVTEAIYEHVRRLEAAPIPGVDFGRPMPEGTPLALMPWPAISGSLRDAHAEREFGALQDLAGIIREARSQHKVEPRRKIVLHADASALAPLGGAASFLPIFAGLERIEPAPKPGQAPPSSVSITFGPATLVLSSLAEQLDAGAERERLSKQVADLAKSIAALEGRLANPGYLAKAPPKLVDETKAEILRKKAELEAARKALEVV